MVMAWVVRVEDKVPAVTREPWKASSKLPCSFIAVRSTSWQTLKAQRLPRQRQCQTPLQLYL